MNRACILLLVYYLTSGSDCQAQPSIQWQKCYGGTDVDGGYFIEQTVQQGYVLTGFTGSNNGTVSGNHGGMSDCWVTVLDSLGNLLWQRCLGGSGFDDIGNSVHQKNDGGYAVAGLTNSNDGDVTGNHGMSDFWIVNLDSSGNLLWQKCLGGSNSDGAYDFDITAEGGFILTGFTQSNDGDVSGNHGGSGDCWVVKITVSGTIEWQKCLGGSGRDEGNSIKQTSDGGYIVACSSDSQDGDLSGSHGGSDFWVVKLDSTGNIVWRRSLGGSGTEYAFDVVQTYDGGYLVAGNSSSLDGDVTGNHGNQDCWIVRLDSTGGLVWQKSYGGNNWDAAASIQQTLDGGCIFAGTTKSNDGDVSGNHGFDDYWVVKTNSTGIIQWQKCLGGAARSYGRSIYETEDGGYAVVGGTSANNGDVSGNHGAGDVWVVKLSPLIGMDEIGSISYLKSYPNPVSEKLILELSLSNKEDLTLRLINILGLNVIQPLTIKGGTGTHTAYIETVSLLEGLYFLQLEGENGSASRKVIVEH